MLNTFSHSSILAITINFRGILKERKKKKSKCLGAIELSKVMGREWEAMRVELIHPYEKFKLVLQTKDKHQYHKCSNFICINFIVT